MSVNENSVSKAVRETRQIRPEAHLVTCFKYMHVHFLARNGKLL